MNLKGTPDLVIDHRQMRASLFLDRQPLNKLQCARDEGCLSPSLKSHPRKSKQLRYTSFGIKNILIL